ncbi:hypothetical protein TNCV_5017631 [Trichonephila clavipes]|nr:hypothetical protein TNCV_5017631 [Trichonephila clavipes]
MNVVTNLYATSNSLGESLNQHSRLILSHPCQEETFIYILVQLHKVRAFVIIGEGGTKLLHSLRCQTEGLKWSCFLKSQTEKDRNRSSQRMSRIGILFRSIRLT